MRKKWLSAAALAVVLATWSAHIPAIGVEPAPDGGRAFDPGDPTPKTHLGAIITPGDADAIPEQRWKIKASDGVDLHVDTWLPTPNEPGEKFPTILTLTPYQPAQASRNLSAYWQAWLQRGYAVSFGHLRGTGASGGCLQRHTALDADDGSRMVEFVGGIASWSNGAVVGSGLSYNGGAILNVAARGDRKRTKYLKALKVFAPHASDYEARWMFDGVRSVGMDPIISGNHLATSLAVDPRTAGAYPYGDPEASRRKLETIGDRPGCQQELLQAAIDPSGTFTPHFEEREVRNFVDRIKIPVLMVHGFADLVPFGGVAPSVQVGLFDRLRGPKIGFFGWWGHGPMDEHPNLAKAWERGDVDAIETKWLDQWVRGVHHGVETWPVVQVQGSDGQWRAERSWPDTGGRVGTLALTAGAAAGRGGLGAREPAGSSTYTEAPAGECPAETAKPGCLRAPGTFVVFETEPLADRLQISGQPVLDLWVELDRPDAHLAATLEVVDVAGRRYYEHLDGSVKGERGGWTFGLRSAQHPLVDGTSHTPAAAVTDTPVRLTVRFQPTDLVVPPGARVRVIVSGSEIINPGTEQMHQYLHREVHPRTGARMPWPDDPVLGGSELSGASTTVRILHDCSTHVSVLRFSMPDHRPKLLNVREKGEVGPLRSSSTTTAITSDGGGLATEPICKQERPQLAPLHP